MEQDGEDMQSEEGDAESGQVPTWHARNAHTRVPAVTSRGGGVHAGGAGRKVCTCWAEALAAGANAVLGRA